MLARGVDLVDRAENVTGTPAHAFPGGIGWLTPDFGFLSISLTSPYIGARSVTRSVT
jgi:hypothetical protein